MKKEHILYYAIFASFLVSLVSLGISVHRNPEELGIDYLGVIVGILAVLVTVLVGLQLYNYIYAQEHIKQIVNQQVQTMVKDYESVTKARDIIYRSYDFVVSDFYSEKMMGAIINAIIELDNCTNDTMKKNGMEYVMKEAHDFIRDSSESEPRIYEGKKAEYLFTLERVNHKYVMELRNYIERAVEVEEHPSKTKKS